MRKLVLDTETTGLDPSIHRVINLAAVELIDNLPTGNFVQFFINPDRESDPRALEIHGLTTEFLSSKPRFHEITEQFENFIAGDPLIIHNADFDLGMLRCEFRRMGRAPLTNRHVCTKVVAQKKYGGAGAGTGARYRGGNKLDDLVKRFSIPNLREQFGVHGALIDSLLLVNVYRMLHDAPVVELPLAKFGIEPSEKTSVTSESIGSAGGPPVPAGPEADAANQPADVREGSR